MSDEVQEHLTSLKNLFNRPFESRWGFTAVHGWVVFDKSNPANSGSPVTLFVCWDWSTVNVSRSGSVLHGSLSPSHPLLSLRIGVGFGI